MTEFKNGDRVQVTWEYPKTEQATVVGSLPGEPHIYVVLKDKGDPPRSSSARLAVFSRDWLRPLPRTDEEIAEELWRTLPFGTEAEESEWLTLILAAIREAKGES